MSLFRSILETIDRPGSVLGIPDRLAPNEFIGLGLGLGFGGNGGGAGTATFLTDPTIALTSGDGTSGSTFTCTDGTVSTGSVTRQWYIAGVAIPGETGATYTAVDADTYLDLTCVNTAAVGGATATSNAITVDTEAPLTDPLTFVFTDTDGTGITSHNENSLSPAFASSSGTSANMTINTNRVICSGSVRVRCLAPPASAEQTVFFDWHRLATGTSSNNGPGVALRMSDSVTTDCYRVHFCLDGNIRILKGTTQLTLTSGGTWNTSTEIPSVGNSRQLYAKVTTAGNGDVTVSAGFATAGAIVTEKASVTILASDTSNIVTATNFVGISFITANTGWYALDNFIVPIAWEALSIDAVAGAVGLDGQAYTLTLNDTTGYGGTTQWRQVDAITGEVLIDWGTSTTPTLERSYCYLDIRNSAQPSIIARSSAMTVYGYHSTQLGVNMGFPYSGMRTVDMMHETHPNYNGFAVTPPTYEGSTSYTTINLTKDGTFEKLDANPVTILLARYVPPEFLGATVRLSADPGTTFSLSAGAKDVSMSSVSSGVYDLAIGANYNTSSTKATLTVTATPTGGITTLTARLVGAPADQIWATGYLTDIARAETIRMMQLMMTNNSISDGGSDYFMPEGAIFWDNDGGAPLAMCIDMCNTNGSDLHLNLPEQITDEAAGDWMALVASDLDPSLKCHLEWSNEVWNFDFTSHAYARHMGVQRGFAPDAVGNDSSLATPETVLYNGDYSDANSNDTRINLVAGDKIMLAINGVGWVVYEARTTVASGTTAPSPGAAAEGDNLDANFKYIYGNTKTRTAGRKFQTARSMELFAIAGQYLDSSRLVRVLGVQDASSTATYEVHLDFDDFYDYVDVIEQAPYWSVDLDAATADASLTSAANEADWLTAYFALVTTAINTKKSGLQSDLTWLQDYLVTKGRSPSQIKWGCYEAGNHTFAPSGTWPQGTATVQGWFANSYYDARFETATTAYLDAIATSIGGPLNYFCDYEIVEGDDTNGNFGLREYPGQSPAPAWDAFDAWVAP